MFWDPTDLTLLVSSPLAAQSCSSSLSSCSEEPGVSCEASMHSPGGKLLSNK